MISDVHIPLTVVWYLVYNDCAWYPTSDAEQITIFHLVLQVYCSPSLKEHLHNPVMPLLTRHIERAVSILCAHGSVCGACVLHVCCMCVACGCVVVCAYTFIVFISTSVFKMVDTTSTCTSITISNHTSIVVYTCLQQHAMLLVSTFVSYCMES